MFTYDKDDVNGDGDDNGDDDASDDTGPPENLDLGMHPAAELFEQYDVVPGIIVNNFSGYFIYSKHCLIFLEPALLFLILEK